MNVYLHTIAIEPSRWTPVRVSRPLIELLGPIRDSGFVDLEIFEPHITLAEDEQNLRTAMREHGLNPVILSSYLDVSPCNSSASQFEAAAQSVFARIDDWGFGAVRIFPGRIVSPDNAEEEFDLLVSRYQHVADGLPGCEILIETHDGSIADEPATVVAALKKADRPNIKLLYQPTVFEAARAQLQFTLQLPWIGHLHLQNRKKDLSFDRVDSGVIPWTEIIASAPANISASIEFVAAGMEPFENFSLEAALAEAVETRDWVQNAASLRSRNDETLSR